MQGYHHFASMACGTDVHFEVIDAEECARRHLLISTENLLGGGIRSMATSIRPRFARLWPVGHAASVPKSIATCQSLD